MALVGLSPTLPLHVFGLLLAGLATNHPECGALQKVDERVGDLALTDILNERESPG
jgi:hypothetical protein